MVSDKENFNREEELKARFNDFWFEVLKLDKDYYRELDTDDFVRMKIALKDINNILTLKLTLSFLDKLLNEKIINADQFDEGKRSVLKTNVNSNGYDLVIEPNGEFKGVVAEVKCNIPVKKKRYGAAQENAIKDDIDGLKNPTKKTKEELSYSSASYYKFMVLYDCKGLDEDISVREAALSILTDPCYGDVALYNSKEDLTNVNASVYIILVSAIER